MQAVLRERRRGPVHASPTGRSAYCTWPTKPGTAGDVPVPQCQAATTSPIASAAALRRADLLPGAGERW